MAQNDIARFPSGVNNMPESSGLADLKFPNPLLYNMIWDDFNAFTAANWTLSGTGTGALVAGGDGGVIALATSGTINTEQAMALPGLTITPSLTKDMVVSARVQLDDVTNGGFFFGLAVAATAPLTTPPNDGIYFRKLTGTDTGQVTVRVGGTNTYNVDLPVVASATWYDLTIAYSAEEGILRGHVGNGAVRVVTGPTAATFPSVPMSVVFAVRNQTAAVRTLLIDNYLVAKAR